MSYMKNLVSMSSVLLFAVVPVFAEEATPLDTGSPPAETFIGSDQYDGPAMITYELSDEDYLYIKINGLKPSEIDAFHFNSMDISDAIGQYQEAGVIEVKEGEDSFTLLVKIPAQQLGNKSEFAVIYGESNRLSAVLDIEKLIEERGKSDRGFGWTRIYGTLSQAGSICGGCGSSRAAYATVHIYTLLRGQWYYNGATQANGYGYYNTYVQGNDASHIGIVAVSGNRSAHRTFVGPRCGRCVNSCINASMYLR